MEHQETTNQTNCSCVSQLYHTPVISGSMNLFYHLVPILQSYPIITFNSLQHGSEMEAVEKQNFHCIYIAVFHKQLHSRTPFCCKVLHQKNVALNTYLKSLELQNYHELTPNFQQLFLQVTVLLQSLNKIQAIYNVQVI